MKPIVEYRDYRQYMRDFYEERKRNSYFTWREFASLSGFVSPTYLKLVCDGKTRLSKPGVAKVARAMGLEGFDYTFFALLVKFENAKTDGEKESALQELEREARMNRIRLVDADAIRYYESPLYPIVRELAPLMPSATFGEMASKIKSAATAIDVREVLQFLVRADLLRNKKMAELAVGSIARDSADERHFSSVTMGIDAPTYERIAREVDAFRKRIVAIANECRKIDQVYQLNLHVFPLTDKVCVSGAKKGGTI